MAAVIRADGPEPASESVAAQVGRSRPLALRVLISVAIVMLLALLAVGSSVILERTVPHISLRPPLDGIWHAGIAIGTAAIGGSALYGARIHHRRDLLLIGAALLTLSTQQIAMTAYALPTALAASGDTATAAQDVRLSSGLMIAALLLAATFPGPLPLRALTVSACLLVGPAVVVISTAAHASGWMDDPSGAVSGLVGSWSGLRDGLHLVAGVVAAGVFLAAAHRLANAAPRTDRRYTGLLVLASVLAALSLLVELRAPAETVGVLGHGDLLFSVFELVVALALVVGLRDRLVGLEARTVALDHAVADAHDAQTRVARDLHDGLLQDLWVARLRLGAVAEHADDPAAVRGLAATAATAIEDAMIDARLVITAAIRPVGPIRAFHQVIADDSAAIAHQLRMDVSVDASGPIVMLEPATSFEITQILREALVNAHRHAPGARVIVTSRVDGSHLSLIIDDEGAGFDPALTTAGFGLASMRGRATRLGGELQVEEADSGGGRLVLRLPIPSSAA